MHEVPIEAGTRGNESATQPKGEVRMIFPVAAVVRYRNPAHRDIPLDGLEFLPASAHGEAESTAAGLNVLHDGRFEALAAFLHDCVRDYLDNVYRYRYEGFEIVHAWVNRTGIGGFQRMHYHGNSIVSGVYYLRADPRQSSPLCFDRPELNSQPYFAIAPREPTMLTANRVAYPAQTGHAYLFPSQLRHGYDTPNGGDTRISLAFNVMLGGIGQFYTL